MSGKIPSAIQGGILADRKAISMAVSISPQIAIPESEIREQFIRASGPGGQNVNKVASAVQLRFDVNHSTALPPGVKQRLLRIGANRITESGELLIEAREFRSQEQNRKEARQRLIRLIRQALKKPKPRQKTAPSQASRARRLESKRRRARLKKNRKPVPPSQD